MKFRRLALHLFLASPITLQVRSDLSDPCLFLRVAKLANLLLSFQLYTSRQICLFHSFRVRPIVILYGRKSDCRQLWEIDNKG